MAESVFFDQRILAKDFRAHDDELPGTLQNLCFTVGLEPIQSFCERIQRYVRRGTPGTLDPLVIFYDICSFAIHIRFIVH